MGEKRGLPARTPADKNWTKIDSFKHFDVDIDIIK